MRAFRQDSNGEREAWESGDSEMDRGSVPGRGEDRLHELTSDFLSAPNPDAPDQDVVGSLYIANFGRLVGVFEQGAHDRTRAQDAVQEAFAALQKHYNKHKALPDDPRSFLFIAARNWLANKARDDSRHREVPMLEEKPSTIEALLDPRSGAREPLQAMASEELRAIAYPAVDELDPTTRKIIELRRKGMEWDEIAKKVEVESGERARKMHEHAVHHVKAALGAHFSSWITTAEVDVRRWVKTRRSAEQAIDLLPPPYDKILHLLLVKGMTEEKAATHLGVSLHEVKRHHERGAEHLHKMWKMTEDEMRDVLLNGR